LPPVGTSTPEQTCDAFNTYFFSVFTSKTMDSIDTPTLIFHGNKNDKLIKVDITVDKMSKALSKIRIDKVAGADKLAPRVLVKIADCITKPLCDIFKSILSEELYH